MNAGIAELLIFHPVRIVAGTEYCECGRADFGPSPHFPGRYHQQAFDEQQGECENRRRQHLAPKTNRSPVQLSFQNLNAVIFKKHSDASVGRKFLSLFPGLGYAAGYKVLQRIYKYYLAPSASLLICRLTIARRFGGQPYANDYLK